MNILCAIMMMRGQLVEEKGGMSITRAMDGLGNQEAEGFGHIAMGAEDVYAASEHLDSIGVTFRKRAGEGELPHVAFLEDPDGNAIELVERSKGFSVPYFTLSQTMLRSARPSRTVAFYQECLGMTLLREQDLRWCHPGYTNYFLAKLPGWLESPGPHSAGARTFVQELYSRCIPVIEISAHVHPNPSLNSLTYSDKRCA